MYCPTCGGAVAQGLSYCNFCGAKLGGARGSDAGHPSEIKPELLVAGMVGLIILGLVSIAVLVGVLKAVAGFDLPILIAITMFSFLLVLVVEAVLIGLLFKGQRRARRAGDAGRLKEQTTQELGEAQARVLPEPVPSVTEQTTLTLDPVYSERQPR